MSEVSEAKTIAELLGDIEPDPLAVAFILQTVSFIALEAHLNVRRVHLGLVRALADLSSTLSTPH